jgi:hypothetical protein
MRLMLALLAFVPGFTLLGGLAAQGTDREVWGLIVGGLVGVFFGCLGETKWARRLIERMISG